MAVTIPANTCRRTRRTAFPTWLFLSNQVVKPIPGSLSKLVLGGLGFYPRSLSAEDSGKGNGPGTVGSDKWCFVFWDRGRGSIGEGSLFPQVKHMALRMGLRKSPVSASQDKGGRIIAGGAGSLHPPLWPGGFQSDSSSSPYVFQHIAPFLFPFCAILVEVLDPRSQVTSGNVQLNYLCATSQTSPEWERHM